MDERFRIPIFEFINKVEEVDSLVSIIVFGSVARDEADKRSDIDLFIIVNKKKDEKKIWKIASDIGAKYDITIQIVFSNEKLKELDPYFIENVNREGIVVYNRKPFSWYNKKYFLPGYIVVYELPKKDSDRTRIKRALFGSKYVKKDRTRSKGLIEEYNVEKICPSTLFVYHKYMKIFADLFKSSNVNYKKIPIWKQK